MVSGGLAAFLQQLRLSLQQPQECEPDVDQKELGVEDAVKFREEEDLQGGAVLKGTLEAGEGDETPQSGDLVFLHYSLLNEHRDVLCSTHQEHGGSGRPQPFVIGRGRRMLRGMELGVQEMTRGERAMLDLKPEYAFQHKDSGIPLPKGVRPEAPVVADVTLTHWYPDSGVKCLGPNSDIFLRTLRAGHGWESPRPPFEVSLHINARTASTSGRQEEGRSYYSSVNGTPLSCSLGAGQLPPAVDVALQAMQRQQEAVVWCPTSLLCGGELLPDPPDALEGAAPMDYAEFKLQLLDFSQVRDMTGDGQVVKRIVRKGVGEFPMDCPLEDSKVQVHYRVKAEGDETWLMDSRGTDGQGPPVKFETGMGEAPEALDMCVRLMLRGEAAALSSTWRYAYEGRQDAPQGLAAGSVEFEVELLGFEKEAHQEMLSGADKLERAARLKDQGNQLFKQGKSKLARQKYGKALKGVEQALDLETEEQFAAASALKASCLLNIARCAEREQEWGEALGWCNKAISEDDGYAKAYFRLAALSTWLGEYESAREDLAICAQLDESTAEECERELRRVEAREQAAEAKQRGALKGFFDR